jgi:hypothetical protein
MSKHTSHGKHGITKPYHSPGHVADHPAHNMPAPSGGLMSGDQPSGMGAPMAPGAQLSPPGMGGNPIGGM